MTHDLENAVHTIRSLALTPPALLACLLAACGGGDPPAPAVPVTYASRCGLPDSAAEPYRSTAPTGPHCVGAAEYLVTDDARDEPMTETPGDRRALQVRVLYPASARVSPGMSGGVRMPYADEAVYAGIDWWPATLRPQGHAWREAAPAIERAAPVLLFSPGLGANAQAYAGLTEDLASHGYVVVTINHPFVSGPTPLPDGRIVRYEEVAEEWEDEEAAEAAHWVRSNARLAVTMADEKSVLDWLARQNATRGALLDGRLDMGRIGAFGHSFGGATALQVQRTDERVKAAVNLDGTVYGDLDQPWTEPFMILQSVHAINGVPVEEPTMKPLWQNRQGHGELEVMAGSCHGDFSDAHRLANIYNARNPATPIQPDPQLYCSKDPAALEDAVRRRLRDFFGRWLR
ncbi:alpha/beta hydrolase family protein [Pseudoduganella albidiflava]|uniref:Lipase n=1 Tax=Pseudoduganella albidiflava TaxID=321983 RepID=A0A411WTQ8_9BURK|nr:hypothetical protein [Pseudoduganella albidiflava]QBH99998.1 hypothetical protein EYF70_03410 [Pseudoduganella albidiflava]GGY55434.1 lipase [Pseudoduganella albidiflava]